MIRELTPDDRSAWSTYVAGHPDSTPFHDPRWGEVLTRSYGYKNVSLGFFEHGKLVGLLPLYRLGLGMRARVLSSPWGDCAGPLTSSVTVSRALLEQASHLAGPQFIDIMSAVNPPSSPSLTVTAPFRSFRLSVARPFEGVLATSIHQKTRNMINKAGRAGVKTTYTPLIDSLRSYYPLYYDTMMRLKQLPFDRRFFKILSEVFKQDAVLFMASWQGKPVAGVVALRFKDTLYIWGNASDRHALNGANNAVYAAALEYACSDPVLKWVDFGSTIPDTSHHQFKQRWGGEEYQLFRISNRPTLESGHSSVLRMLPFLPSPLVRTLARIAYRYF